MGNNAGYRVNDDGSVTKCGDGSKNNGNKPSNNSSNHGGCVWGAVIAIVVIVALIVIKSNMSSNSKIGKEDTTVAVEDLMVEEVVADNIVPTSTSPISSISGQCTLKSMDNVYDGYMLVPTFLSHSEVREDGGRVYYADNGAYLTSVITDYDGSAYQYISQMAGEMNSTYSAHKEYWAVDSGLYGNQIYYMKAVKSGGRIYCAAFFVPRGDKPNAKLYTRLTEKIFNSTNFPLW